LQNKKNVRNKIVHEEMAKVDCIRIID